MTMGFNNRRGDNVKESVQHSFLRSLPSEAVEHLLSNALSLDIPAGSIIYHESDDPRGGTGHTRTDSRPQTRPGRPRRSWVAAKSSPEL